MQAQGLHQQQPAAATNVSASVPVLAPADAVPVAPQEDVAPATAAAADHEDSTAAGDSDDTSSEGEQEETDRGWGTYSPIAAAIDAGRKVSCLHI